jgi:hypothetical protein
LEEYWEEDLVQFEETIPAFGKKKHENSVRIPAVRDTICLSVGTLTANI